MWPCIIRKVISCIVSFNSYMYVYLATDRTKSASIKWILIWRSMAEERFIVSISEQQHFCDSG